MKKINLEIINMKLSFKKILFTILLNLSLFTLLIIGTQNSNKKSKVNLLVNDSVKLPIGFIVGSSFIAGSLAQAILVSFIKDE